MPNNIIKIKPIVENQEIKSDLIIHKNLELPDSDILEKGNIVPCWSGNDKVETIKNTGTIDEIYNSRFNGKPPEFFKIISNRDMDEESLSIKISNNFVNANWGQNNIIGSDQLVSSINIKKYKLVIKIGIIDSIGIPYRSYEDDYKGMSQIAFWEEEEKSCFIGDGGNRPLGFLKYNESFPARRIEVIKAKASEKIDVDDIINIISCLDVDYKKNASFVFNPMLISILEALTDKAEEKIYKSGHNPTLFGFPVYLNINMPIPRSGALAILFGDFKKFIRITDIGEAIKEYKYPSEKVPGQTVIAYTKASGAGVVEPRAFCFLQMKD